MLANSDLLAPGSPTLETDADLDAVFGRITNDAPERAVTRAKEPRRRKRATKKAEPRADPFPVEEPWHTPVDGSALLDSLCTLLRRYLVLPPTAAEALALWIVHTYVIDASDYTPYILITSPVRECGKSTLLELLSHLAYRAQLTGGITAAALFRRIDRLHPTMLLDEMDARLKSDGGENLRGVLNTGFHRTGKMTICVGEDHEERDFATFSPKVLAGIGRVWDTVTSRSIPLRLRRATKEELRMLSKIRGDRINGECLQYRQKLLRWAEALLPPLRVADPVAPDELGARQSDVWRPLFAIADEAGGHWPQTARDSARVLHGVAEEEGDYGLLLLGDLRDIFKASGESRLTSVFTGEELAKLDARPWPEYRNGRPITPAGVASLIKRFGVKSKNIRVGVDVQKGYEVDALEPLFTVYLRCPEQAATPATGAVDGSISAPSGAVAAVAADSAGRGRQPKTELSKSSAPPEESMATAGVYSNCPPKDDEGMNAERRFNCSTCSRRFFNDALPGGDRRCRFCIEGLSQLQEAGSDAIWSFPTRS